MSMSTIFVTSEYPSFCGQMCRDENGQLGGIDGLNTFRLLVLVQTCLEKITFR